MTTPVSGLAPPTALLGLRVVEAGVGVAPAFAGRWLAAFGATVVKIEPPGGSWTRAYPPTGGPVTGPIGPLAAYLDAGKQSLVLDPEAPDYGERLRATLASADVVLHDQTPSPLADLNLDADAARRPPPVEVALTPFGSQGPYAGYAATSIVLLALGGYQYLTGEPGREPLMLPGFQPEYLTGLYGIVAALAGIVGRAPGAAGRRFEVPALEALASLHQFTATMWLYKDRVRSRHGNRWEDLYPVSMLPCRDGYVAFSMPTAETWERLCHMIERTDLLADERLATPDLRWEHADELDAILGQWLADRDRATIYATAQARFRLALNPYLELEETLRDPQYAARGFWVRPAADAPALVHPGLPVAMSETPWRIGRAPAVNEHQDAPMVAAPDLAPAAGSNTPAVLPLSGLRVLDLTRVWAGPLCTRILADLGARVVRVEAPVDPAARPTAAAASGKLQRNKLGLGIDLRRPAGRELVKRLAAGSDVLVENFSARVMPKLGLDYPTLREANPGLIYLAMSGYGTVGPYREYVAYGSTTEAMAGLAALLGYPGEEPLNSAIAYPDAVTGLAGTAAVLTALVHRARTGRGQFLDLSQLECATLMLGELFLASQAEGRAPARLGNTHPVWAPHGTYPCRGQDQWISLAVRSDAEWRAFCAVTGLFAEDGDPAWATAAGRRARRPALDAAISTWTRGQDKRAAMERLQQAGVPAGAVLDARELVENPHLASRGFFVDARSPAGACFRMPGTPITIDGQKRQEWQAAPGHGEHNRAVLKDVLGLDDAEIESLLADGALVSGPAA